MTIMNGKGIGKSADSYRICHLSFCMNNGGNPLCIILTYISQTFCVVPRQNSFREQGLDIWAPCKDCFYGSTDPFSYLYLFSVPLSEETGCVLVGDKSWW